MVVRMLQFKNLQLQQHKNTLYAEKPTPLLLYAHGGIIVNYN